MKPLIRWIYSKIVNELFVPEYSTFAIGMKHNNHIWNSYLPEVLSLKVKTIKNGWQDVILER